MLDSNNTQQNSTHSLPLSPHLSIYKPQLTSVLSILHRITGVALAAGSLLICSWLLSVLAAPEYFSAINSLLSSWLGKLVLISWSWATIYHLCNGIRHLCWDLGYGLSLQKTYQSGWLVIGCSFFFCLLLWSVPNV
ncbi:MAG: succinate dehydrogenase, cytochrome b556 subunit [Pseudomonadota bacterium]